MGELTAFFCPDLKYLFETSELLNKGETRASNYVGDSFERVSIAAVSKETEHAGSIILLERASSIRHIAYRVSSNRQSADSVHGIVITELFTLPNVQEDLRSIDVLDDFAVLIDVRDNVYIMIRPEEEGADATLALPLDLSAPTNLLLLNRFPIVSHSIYKTGIDEYAVNIIVKVSLDQLYPLSYDLTIDKV